MKLNLQKIERFYQSDLGRYTKPRIQSLLAKHIPQSMGKVACIASAGLFPFFDLVDRCDRLALQSNDESFVPKNKEAGQGHFVAMSPSYWPYRAEEVDLVILIHDIEFMSDPEAYLKEAWRVLKGEGRLIIVFPNRAGLWARSDNNPFGQGYPYSPSQMQKLLAKAHFTVDDSEGALYHSSYLPKTKIAKFVFYMVDLIGKYCLLTPGVVMFCASKHVYSPSNGLKVMEAAQKAKQALFPKPLGNPKSR